MDDEPWRDVVAYYDDHRGSISRISIRGPVMRVTLTSRKSLGRRSIYRRLDDKKQRTWKTEAMALKAVVK